MRGGCSGRGAIIGLSIKTIGEAEAAPVDLIDYVGIGGVFATTLEEQRIAPIGAAGLARIVAVFMRRARRSCRSAPSPASTPATPAP